MSDGMTREDDAWLERVLEYARRRWWLEVVMREGRLGLLLGCGMAALVAVGVLIWPGLAWIGGWVAAVWAMVMAVRLVRVWRGRPNERMLLGRVDRGLALPDELLSTWELAQMREGAGDADAWERSMTYLRRTARGHGATVDWQRIWPLPRVGVGLVAGVGMLIFAMVIGYVGWVERLPGVGGDRFNRMKHLAPVFEVVAEDWELAGEQEEGKMFEEFADGLRELLAAMDAGELTEREVVIELAAVKAMMEAMQAELREEDWRAQLRALAREMESQVELNPMAGALNREEWAAAQAEALALEEMMTAPGEGEEWDEAAALELAAALEEWMKALEENPELAALLRELAKGREEGERLSPQEAMAALRRMLGNQMSREQREQAIAAALAQLQAMKQMAMQPGGMQPGGMEPGVASFFSPGEEPGEGILAGTEAGEEPQGRAGEAEEERFLAALQGQIGEGESTVTVRESEQGVRAGARGEVALDFSVYEKLSFDAVRNEELPLSHREVIRRYFEGIRPTVVSEE